MMVQLERAKQGASEKGREDPPRLVRRAPNSRRVFGSAEAARLARITLRQVHWWDESRIVSPWQEDQRIVDAMRPVYVINLAEQVKRLNSESRPLGVRKNST